MSLLDTNLDTNVCSALIYIFFLISTIFYQIKVVHGIFEDLLRGSVERLRWDTAANCFLRYRITVSMFN